MTDADAQRLRDENAIRGLTALYSDAVTHLDAARAASAYAEDGCVSIVGHETIGRAAIENGMRESFSAHSLLQLIAHGGVIEVDGDRATARWSTIELTVRREDTHLNVILGRYEDLLVRLDDGWRFKRRTYTLAGRTRLATTRLQTNPDFFTSLLPAADSLG